MRHKILIVSAAALFTLSSCGEDFLYKAPQGSIDQEALTNAEGVELLVVNAYAGLTRPTGYDNMFNWVFGGVYGGDANKGSESNDQSVLNSVETYAVTATNDYLLNKWKDALWSTTLQLSAQCDERSGRYGRDDQGQPDRGAEILTCPIHVRRGKDFRTDRHALYR